MQTSTQALIQQLKILGDPTRLRLVALCRQGECSVSELVQVIGQSQPRISQHLRQLCDAQILRRFRDGKRVFYRAPSAKNSSLPLSQLLELIPDKDPVIIADWKSLRQSRGEQVEKATVNGHDDSVDRALHRAILDLSVTTPIGDLLDIGCGRGSLLKLLASRANRAVGVDIDSNARQLARAELLLAGIPNCSFRKGDMYRLPFADQQFNTIIIDDVLIDALDPVRALDEASRLLKASGRMILLESVANRTSADIKKSLADWCNQSGLRLSPARLVPKNQPAWLVSVAVPAGARQSAA